MSRIDCIINFKELYYEERNRRIELEKQLELEKIKVKKLMNQSGRAKTRYCTYCSANLSSKKELPKDDSEIISELKDFSYKMDSIMKLPSLRHQNTEPSMMSKIEESSTVEPHRKRHVGLIENFAVFGLKDATIKSQVLESKSLKEFEEGEILFSQKAVNETEMQASKLVFPSGMAIKKCQGLKAKEKTIELMSYCYTNLKAFVLNFECPESMFYEHFHQNELLDHINPDHRLFCICIGIHDYTCGPQQPDKINISLGTLSNGSFPSAQDPQIKSEGYEGSPSRQKDSSKSIEDMIESAPDLEMGITQRVFCIMSYYPFFSFFEEILRNLINIVKMERLTVYKHNNEDIRLTIRQTDSEFQLQRMTELLQDCLKELEFKKVSFNKEYEYKLIDQKKLSLFTYWDEAKTFFVREWVFSILSIFSFESFLDLLTLIMLEDRVVFICENSHILTHAIYLFTHVFFKPLNYSFPIVSIVPGMDETYLHAPFPVVYGLLKKRKNIEESNLLENYDFTYVFLSPEKADVYYQENRKEILNNRSTKLLNNKELKEIFRDLRKSRKKETKTAKYELESTDYCVLASQEEKEKGVRIVSILSHFMSEEVVKKLPSRVEL
jgi:hypothetical protein